MTLASDQFLVQWVNGQYAPYTMTLEDVIPLEKVIHSIQIKIQDGGFGGPIEGTTLRGLIEVTKTELVNP